MKHVDPTGREWGSIAAMASAHGLSRQTVMHRLKQGLTIKQALRPVGAIVHPATGERVTVKVLAAEVGLSLSGLKSRVARGHDLLAPKARCGQ